MRGGEPSPFADAAGGSDSDDQRGLTALGHTQAVATAARIKAMTQNTSNPVEITKLWHSNLRRSSSPTASRVA